MDRFVGAALFSLLLCALAACAQDAPVARDTETTTQADEACLVELIVLGAGQDAGAPQIGNADDPAWQDTSLRQSATSIALVAHQRSERYLFDATPHITEQIELLDRLAPVPVSAGNLDLDGVFLTHAHIGHYAGLMFLGREAAGTSDVPVYVMPRMADFLHTNGPWSQLVALGNITLVDLQAREAAPVLSPEITAIPYQVPHRDEYSETVGFEIQTGGKSALYLPDIDSWQAWEDDFSVRLENMLARVDIAFLDASFFDDNELPGRDMSLIPHPRVVATMDRLQHLPDEVRARVHFIHYNHTNPIRFANSEESALVLERGFGIARAGDRHCLSAR